MSGKACSVMCVCSLLLMMCYHEWWLDHHSIEEGPKLLLSCSNLCMAFVFVGLSPYIIKPAEDLKGEPIDFSSIHKKRDGFTSRSPQKRSRQESNLRTRLRRPMLYPLSYGNIVSIIP